MPCHLLCPTHAAAAKLDQISRKISVLSSFIEPDTAPEALADPAAAKVPVAASAAGEDSEEGEEVYADGLDESEAAGGAAGWLSWAKVLNCVRSSGRTGWLAG
jgi:hypothetical protein